MIEFLRRKHPETPTNLQILERSTSVWRGLLLERHRKGDLTEAIVIAELQERNISVAKPIGDNERYDLIVESPRGDLLQVQVKTARYDEGTIVFDGTSQAMNSSGPTYETYTGDVDYFIAYSHRFETLYLVQADRVQTGMHLRVEEPEIDHPAINWASDFEFDRCWPPDNEWNEETYISDQNLPTHRRGDATEARVIAELLDQGVTVAEPSTDNERFDLILESPTEEFYRVQVKTGWISDHRVTFRGSSSHVNAEGVVHKPYDGDIDYFLVYEPSIDEMYFLAEDSFDTSIFLRLDESKQPDRTAHYAEDYLFDLNWPPAGSQAAEKTMYQSESAEMEERIMEAFNDLGATVAQPVEDDTPYDLLVQTKDLVIMRISIQRAEDKDGHIFFNPDSPRAADQIDRYVVYSDDSDKFYLLAPSIFDSSVTLWTEEPEEVRRTTLRAEEYELNYRWPPRAGGRVRTTALVSTAIEAFDDFGAAVAFPADPDSPFEILVEANDGRYYRINVEPGWISNGRIRLKPKSDRNPDYYLLVCRQTDTCYLVSPDEFEVTLSLRVEPPERDDGTVNYADEFELKSRWPIGTGA